MLIDGGGSIGPVHSEFDFGEDVVAPYLWSRGLEHLDVVALTHAHGDHIGGLPRILEDFHPAELWVGINPDTTATAAALRDSISKPRCQCAGTRRAMCIGLGRKQGTRALAAAGLATKPKKQNDDSLVAACSLWRNQRAAGRRSGKEDGEICGH